jgi:hypothetical protein
MFAAAPLSVGASYEVEVYAMTEQETGGGQEANPHHDSDAKKAAEELEERLNPSSPANTGTTPGTNAKVG